MSSTKPRRLAFLLQFAPLLVALSVTEAALAQPSTAPQPAAPSVTVTLDPLVHGEISPMQYGQFIEYLCDLVPGMWADKLDDGSFLGLTPAEAADPNAQTGKIELSNPYRYSYIWQTDFRQRRWYPSGAVNRAVYSLDPLNTAGGKTSKKIAATGATPCTVGISQDGVWIERKIACDFSCSMRQEGIGGPVQVSLHHDGVVYASGEVKPTGAWTKVHLHLQPAADESNATLTLRFRGPGTLWLDNASLMPHDNVGGWRRDVVEAVRALKPGVIRFGGSIMETSPLGDFDWRQTIGDPDRRTPFRSWGGLQPKGPGLEEIVQFCQAAGAEPLICVRFTERKPRDAADEVEYFNGAATTPMGMLRAKNGHPAPYHILYWQVGNEISLRDNPEYGTLLPDFCKAMKQADPAIKILSSYPSVERIRGAAEWLDYACPHQYHVSKLQQCDKELTDLQQLISTAAPGKNIKIAVTEWNTTAGSWGTGRAKLWTLANALACSRYHNLMHRHCDSVEIANRSNLTNSFCSGIIQTRGPRMYLTPTWYAQQLYATLAGNRPLKVQGAAFEEQGLDLSATLSTDGRTITLFAVNDTANDMTRQIHFPPSAQDRLKTEISVWTLGDRDRAGEPDVTNDTSDPERITSRQSHFTADGASFTGSFPAYSLTVLQWK